MEQTKHPKAEALDQIDAVAREAREPTTRIRTGNLVLLAADELRAALAAIDGPFLVKGSPGRGSKWAAVPWIAVFDPAVTT
ncbi:DUF3578 domain-containing protein, partial [Methylobacterium organophilum]|nr:DUF3578 domain-containing protein [Methylobacterium organophilum]